MGHYTRAKNVALVFAINKLTVIAFYTRNLFNSKLRHSEQREESKQFSYHFSQTEWILRCAQNDGLSALM